MNTLSIWTLVATTFLFVISVLNLYSWPTPETIDERDRAFGYCFMAALAAAGMALVIGINV